MTTNSAEAFVRGCLCYHGHTLSIIWDKDGTIYNKGAGLTILADGQKIGHSVTLARVKGRLPTAE